MLVLAVLCASHATAIVSTRWIRVDARRRKLLEWYAMHAVVNFIISGLTLPAALAPVRREACAPAPRSTFPIELTVWLHVYHGLFFELSRADVWHHGFFLGLLGVPGMIFDWGSCGDAQLFFLCGLPGAIIYVMAILKHVLTWRHEKKLTFAITALVRAPGALRAQYQLFLGRDLVRAPSAFVTLQLVIGPINALFYAVESTLRLRTKIDPRL